MKLSVWLVVCVLCVSAVQAYYTSVRDNAFVPAFSTVGVAGGKQVIKSMNAGYRQAASREQRTSNFRPGTFYRAWGIHKEFAEPKPLYQPPVTEFEKVMPEYVRRSSSPRYNLNPLNRRMAPGYYIGRYGLEEQYIKTWNGYYS